MPAPANAPAVPRLTYLRIKNYRALRDVEFRDLTPLSVFIGPNGSGKSTVLDALAFLAEAVSGNLTQAWEKRNRFAGMRTRGSEGNIEIEVEVGDLTDFNNLRYKVEISESNEGKVSIKEVLTLKEPGGDVVLLEIEPSSQEGWIQLYSPWATKNLDDEKNQNSPDTVSIGSSSQIMLGFAFTVNRRLSKYAHSVIDILKTYSYFDPTDKHREGYSDQGPRERLSANGDNLPNVLYYLHLKHPEVLAKITAQMRRWVPALADIVPEITSDERLLLRFKDAPFEKPLPAQYMSDGTMRLAALLTLLYEPDAAGLLGIEEPENELHPQLLPRLAEELIAASETRQLLIATHSPALLNALEPEQVWILHRGPDGYTRATRTADLPGIPAMVEEGSPLGYLWSRNFFDVGNPLNLPAPIQ